MAQSEMAVADDLVVGLDYTLTLDDGEVVDASGNSGPLEYLHGHGQLIAGLERELTGMAPGQSKKVSVRPTDGYGEYDDEAFELVPHEAFPADLDLEPDMELQMRDSQTGQVLQAYVSDIRDDGVLLDLNHPLAGETLHFEVTIASVRRATAEELSHGHAHGTGHAH